VDRIDGANDDPLRRASNDHHVGERGVDAQSRWIQIVNAEAHARTIVRRGGVCLAERQVERGARRFGAWQYSFMERAHGVGGNGPRAADTDDFGSRTSSEATGREDVVRARPPFAEPEYRAEGPLKVTGHANYAADASAPGMLWAAYVRSPHAHALIRSIDAAAARAVPGVHAVLTADDLPPSARFGRRLQDYPVLCRDRVRFIGDRVAAVAAETRELPATPC